MEVSEGCGVTLVEDLKLFDESELVQEGFKVGPMTLTLRANEVLTNCGNGERRECTRGRYY